jgi:hypothetical protein
MGPAFAIAINCCFLREAKESGITTAHQHTMGVTSTCQNSSLRRVNVLNVTFG